MTGSKFETSQSNAGPKSVLAVVVTYNAMPWIERVLSSLDGQAEALVVDNASTDGTPEFVVRRFPAVHLIRNALNTGFGSANNVGMDYALAEGFRYVYLMNQDAWLAPGAMQEMVRTMELHKDYGIVCPVQTDASGRHLELVLTRQRDTAQRIAGDALRGCLEILYELRFAPAAHWLMSHRCIENTGRFSPVFRHYAEDDNYVQRMQAAGLRLGLCTSARAVHDRGERPSGGAARRLFFTRLEWLKHASNVRRPLWFNLLHFLLYYACTPFYLLLQTALRAAGRNVLPYYFHTPSPQLVVNMLTATRRQIRSVCQRNSETENRI